MWAWIFPKELPFTFVTCSFYKGSELPTLNINLLSTLFFGVPLQVLLLCFRVTCLQRL